MEGILYCRQGGRVVAGADGVDQVAREGVPYCGPCSGTGTGTVGSIPLSSKFTVASHSQPVSPVRFSTRLWEPNQASLPWSPAPVLIPLVASLQLPWLLTSLTTESLALSSLLTSWTRSNQAGHSKVKCGFLGDWLCSCDHCCFGKANQPSFSIPALAINISIAIKNIQNASRLHWLVESLVIPLLMTTTEGLLRTFEIWGTFMIPD